MQQLTGAQILMETLIEQGVDTIFGYPGGSVINIYDALYARSDRIRHVLCSHEQGAAHAADGYARATGGVGVCLATSGPGATNLVTGIAAAYLDSVPMVAITGNVSSELLGKDSFQEIDITGVTVPVTKHNFFIKDAQQLASTVRRAFEVAVSGRPGPVLIDIPKDVTAAHIRYAPVGRYQKRALPMPQQDALATALAMLKESRRPLIYFGGGVLAAGAEQELQAFAKKLNAPLCASTMGLSAVPNDFPLYLGLLGMHGTPVAGMAVANCDLLIAVGTRFSDRATGNKAQFAKQAAILHIDVDPSEIDKNIAATHAVAGDARETLASLLAQLPQKDNGEWTHKVLSFSALNPLPGMARERGVDPRALLRAVRRSGGEQTIIVTDVGQHQMYTAQHYPFATPRTFLSSLGLGAMGYGMGAAVGAKVARPQSPVALITGDGCFHMNMAELAVAVTERLPIVVIIMNNGVLGMVRQWQRLFYDGRYSATTLNRQTDFVKLAEAFGAHGIRISDNAQVEDAVQQAFASDGPVVLDCLVDPDEMVFPIIPPGGTSRDMIFAD